MSGRIVQRSIVLSLLSGNMLQHTTTLTTTHTTTDTIAIQKSVTGYFSRSPTLRSKSVVLILLASSL